MNTLTTIALVKKLVGNARDFARESRRSRYSKDYWKGMSQGCLASARAVASAAGLARWCNARWCNARIARKLAPERTAA
jgi:hypothetical protein